MKKDVLTQDQVILYILKTKSNHQTTLGEIKACCDAICKTFDIISA